MTGLRKAVLPAVLVFAAWIFGADEATTPEAETAKDHSGPRLGEPLAPYAAVTLDGDTVRLEEFRGSVVLLNFWDAADVHDALVHANPPHDRGPLSPDQNCPLVR